MTRFLKIQKRVTVYQGLRALPNISKNSIEIFSAKYVETAELPNL